MGTGASLKMEIFYCVGCNQKVAEIQTGSKIKKDAIMLCGNCEIKRKAADMRMQGEKIQNPFEGIFGKGF